MLATAGMTYKGVLWSLIKVYKDRLCWFTVDPAYLYTRPQPAGSCIVCTQLTLLGHAMLKTWIQQMCQMQLLKLKY